MPIFDNELIDNTRQESSLEGPAPVLGSFEGTKLNMNAGGAMFAPVNQREFSLDELRQITTGPSTKGFGQTFTSAPQAELLANQRYPVYQRGVDLENIYGLQQSWYQQLGNGVAKLGANLVGTYAQSLTNIPNTISAFKSGSASERIARLSGNPEGYEGTVDNWMKNMDDFLPNYMTRYERDHPYSTAIPFTRGSANWWGGKFLPNLGFMGGAALGAVTQDLAIAAVTEGVGEIPLVASQFGKAALYLNKIFSAESKVGRLFGATELTKLGRVTELAQGLGKTESQILNMTKLAQLSAASKVNSGFRYGMAIYGSAMTEAGVESRDAYRQVKDELTKQYIADNGAEPDFNAAQEIENSATNAMNVRFGINMALLTASNTLQFGNLFKSITAAKGTIQSLEGVGKIGLAEGSLDVFEKKAAKTIAGKVWESIKPGVENIVREGVFEEGGQFAAERGTYDYYTRKYKSDKYKQTWSDLNEVINSTTFGMKEQFGSQEGIENMLIGGLTGLIIGKVQNLYENKKGIGETARAGNALNILNRFGITNTLQRKYDDTVTQAGIAKDMQEAAKSGDVFKYKNFQEDGFFNFVQSRLPYGMHDVTIEQLEMLRDLPKDQFEQMFQLDFNETNKGTVNEYVDALINKANDIKKTSDAINSVFTNPFKNNPKEGDVESQMEADNYDVFEDYKLDLGYYASIAPNVNRRRNSIQQDVNNIVPGVSIDTLDMLVNNNGLKSLSEMYEQKANQLNSTVTEFTSVQDKINIKNQVKALRTRSERIAMALGDGKMTDKLFQDLLNFEINGQDATKDEIVPIEQVQKLLNYGIDANKLNDRKQIASKAYDELSTREGFEKYFEQAEQIASDREAVAEEETPKEEKPEEKPVEEKKEPVYKNKAGVEETLEKGREYQIPAAKVAKVKKIADDRWEVSYPGGPATFYKTKEDADAWADSVNDELGNLQKVKVLGFNEDGSIKVENLKGDIIKIQPSRLTGYERLETKEEKFSKAAGDINREQEELEKKSGSDIITGGEAPEVATGPIDEGKLKLASEFYISGTDVSEFMEDPTNITPHMVRSRVFMNNAKNFKNRSNLRSFIVTPNQAASLGLNGLVQLQYNRSLDADTSDIENLNDKDLGFVAQVFVEEENGKIYFVDEKGERISEVNGQQTDMSRIVFKSMPTTELYYTYKDKNGNPVPRYRQGEKDLLTAYSNSWRASREQLFKSSGFPVKLYKFKISRGIPKITKINGEIQRSHAGATILPENKIATQQGLIIIPAENKITHQGRLLKWNKGNPAIQFADTLEFINNNKLDNKKAKSVYEVFKALANDVMKQYASGKGITLNKAYLTYLQNVLYYKKGATGGNKFTIDTANMSLVLGNKNYKLDEIGNNEKEMIEQLTSLYHNLNGFTLKDDFYKPFYEYVYENDELKEIEWPNYQSYLLSAKYPDGKSRSVAETPYVTNVTPPTKSVPYSFTQKYATLIDYDLPPIEMPKAAVKEAKPGVPMIGQYDMGGETTNTYPSQLGPVVFTGTISKDAEGKDVVDVDVKDNDTVTKLADDPIFVQKTVIPSLKELNRMDESDDDITLVKKWLGYKVIAQLYNIKEETEKVSKEEEIVPTEEIKPAEEIIEETKPVEDVSKQIADLERDIENKQIKLQELEIRAEVGDDPYANTYIYIVNNLPKIKPESAKKETGAKAGANKDINPSLLNSKTGVSVERAAEIIVALGQEENVQLEEDFVRNEIIEILQVGKGEYKKRNGKIDKKEIDRLRQDIDDLINQLESLQKPGGTFNVDESLDPGEYMRIGVNIGEVPMTDAELQIFKQWHAKNVSGIPFEVLDNVVITYDNEKSFGVFENGVAKFYKGAPGTAPYHEVGEGIWKAFLTPEEKQLLLDEFKAKSGQFTDRASRKQIYYADATDQQAKERILDDFAEFKNGKIKAKSLGQRVLAFFKNIIEFFKSFVQKPSMKEQLFKAIEAGKFKTYKVGEASKAEAPEYMRIPGLTETQAYNFVQDMVIRSGRIMFGGGKKFIYEMNDVSGDEVFKQIEQEYIKENKRQQLSDAAWTMLKKRTIESLRPIGVRVTDEDVTNINASETTGRSYAPEPFATNWKKNSPYPIKFLAYTLPEAEPTNQENSNSLLLPKRKITPEVKGLKMVGYGKVMATLFNKLANTTDPKLMGEKVAQLAKEDANFVRFFQNIGGIISTDKVMVPAIIDFSQFKNEDWRLYIQFFQTFSVQKPEAYIQYVTGSQVYTRPANQFTAAKEIEYGWYEAMKTLSQNATSLVVLDKNNNTYKINEKNYPTKLPKADETQTDYEAQLNFLKKLGIDFGLDTYIKLKEDDVNTFTTAVGDIYAYLKDKKEIGKITGKELGINSYVAKIADLFIKVNNPIQDSTYPGVDGTRLQAFTQNNYYSIFANKFNNTKTFEELISLMPQLQDVFSQNSVVLMNNGLFYNTNGERMKLFKISYIQGERINDTNSGTTTSDLTIGIRMTQEINQNLNGEYYVLLPADSSTEWMINVGNYIRFEEITTNRAWNKIYKVFNGYLRDDINLALDWKERSKLKNVGDKAKELRFFKEILSTYDKEGNLVPSETLSEINRRIEDGQSIDKIMEYVNDKEVTQKINAAVKTAIDASTERTKETLIEEGQLTILPKSEQSDPNVYSYPKLDNTFTTKKDVLLNKFKLSEEDVNNVLTFARANYMIANIEFHKVLFGDPYQFKIKNGILDELKRVKSTGSPRRVTFNVPEYNTHLNDEYNTMNGEPLDEKEYGHHLYKDYVRTITFKDVNFATENYPEVNEGDGAAWLMDTAYKEFKLKNAQWPKEAEAFHQWQMAYTRQNIPGYVYQSESLRKHDEALVKKPEPTFVVEILKPVVTGVKASSTKIDLVVDKYAILPIYYKAVKGRNLEQLYIKMWKEKADYGVMESGRKLGAPKELETLYNDKDDFNNNPYKNFVDVPWEALGIQVENSYDHEKDQTWGSQPAKISSMDYFENGEEAMPGARKAYDIYIDSTNRYFTNKYDQLLKKLGLEDLGNGFNLKDKTAIANTLEGEMLRRALSENVKYAIQLDENNEFPIPFEASTHYKQIKDILYSMVNKSLISPKLNGGPKPLSPVTLWEELGKRNPNKPSPTLKSYTKDDPYIEILLPYKYKKLFNKRRFPTDESILEYLNNTDEGRMLKGVAFRIPDDAQNKIETYRIAGFLPQFMDAVIGPSDLVAKAGLDFDFDKENIYLKSVYVDKNGDVRIVKYLNSEEATKEFFAKVFDDRLEKKKVSKAEILEALQTLDLGLDDPNNLVDKYSDLLDILLEDTTTEDRTDALMKELEKLGDVNFQAALKDKYVDDMYNRALENDYIQSLEDMLTLPGNFERRTVATSDAGLKAESENINTLKGKGKERIKNRLLDGVFMTSARHYFSMGKQWVGIVATNITSHSLFQKTQVTLDTSRFSQLSDYDRGILGDGSVVLPHNKIKINGVDRLSLSGTKTADGRSLYISDRLAGYETAVVDIVKDNFITDIIYSDLLISPAMFLERAGAGEYVSKFLNQPIIKKYISNIEAKGERGLFSKKNIDKVSQLFPAPPALINKVGIDIKNFDGNIERYFKNKEKFTPEQNAEQHNILKEFLKYAKMANYSFKLTQAINYDTSKFRNSDSFSRKDTKTKIAQQKNIFCCAEDILKQSFIETQRDLLDSIMSAMGEIIKTEKDEYTIITDSVIGPYEEVEFMKDDDFAKIASKAKASFLDFIIQSKSGLNTELAELTLGDNSVANQLEEAKKKYPNMQLLKDLQVTSSDLQGGAKSVKLRVKISDPVDENMYTEMMRELYNIDPQLFNSLLKLSIIQGTYDSSISIKNIIPPERYSEFVKPIIDSLAPTLDVQAFSNGSFQKNNWKDNTVVPIARVTFFPDKNSDPFEDQFGNEYTKYISPSFKERTAEGNVDMRVMFLSPKYNSSDIQYDFLKVNRITTVNKEKIDVETGMTVLDSTVYNRRKAGDFSVDDVFGYQKVRDGLGNPVTTADGDYVYKQVNLWGDGSLAVEHYPDGRRSIYNNGSVQINQELPIDQAINFLSGVVKAEKEVIPSQPIEQAPASTTGLSTASGKVILNDGKEYNISDINAALLESIGYTPKQIGKLLKSIC